MKSTKKARQTLASKDNSLAPELRLAIEHVGLFSRVAGAVGKTPSHVLRVAKGDRKSKRVQDAIIREVRRIERRFGVAA